MHMRLLDAAGGEIDPAAVDWKAGVAPSYTVRQDPGAWNSLGYLRIDMPNPHSVYMHDTPHRELFSSDMRFHSSGCARIGDVRALATWLLHDNPGWGRREIDAGIASGVFIAMTKPCRAGAGRRAPGSAAGSPSRTGIGRCGGAATPSFSS